MDPAKKEYDEILYEFVMAEGKHLLDIKSVHDALVDHFHADVLEDLRERWALSEQDMQTAHERVRGY